MSIMLRCGYNQGQPEFVQVNPLNLVTDLPASQVGVAWGQNVAEPNFLAIITGLKQCSDVIRENGFPAPSPSQYIYVVSDLNVTGKGQITIADVPGTQVVSETGVSISYGAAFQNIPHSTEFIQDTIQRLIQGFRELVLVPWPGIPPI